MDILKQRIILTGAGGAIGKALARELYHQGARLVLTGRNMVILEELQSEMPGVEILGTDLSSDRGCSKIISFTTQTMGGIDILINLAGVGQFSQIEHHTAHDVNKLMSANLYAPIILSKLAIEIMLTQENACKIVNIGSILGSVGGAWHSVYAATKFGLRGFSESLRRELHDSNVSVSYVAPRAVSSHSNPEHVQKMMDKVCLVIDSPEVVAKKIISAIKHDKKEYHIGFLETLLTKLNVILPNLCDFFLKYVSRASKPFLK